MVKHIVMWKLKDHANGADKHENAKKMKSILEALKDKIKEIKRLEVGINAKDSDGASDVVLYSEFESFEALEAYIKHPEHIKAANFVGEIRSERRMVDYEV